MKNLNYLLLGLAGFALASCSQEDLNAPVNGDGLQITINLPAGMTTRADNADIPAEMTLNYAVYDSNDALVEDGTATFQGTSTTFSTNLLSGHEYTLAFFAQNSTTVGTLYTFDAESGQVEVDYEEMNNGAYNNAGVYDCFYGTYAYPGEGASSNITVTLNRPLAQINWGTNDLTGKIKEIFSDSEGNLSLYTTLETEAYSQFSVLTGDLIGDAEKVTLGAFAAPTGTYPSVADYDYIAVNYLLAGKTSAIYDLNLNVSNTATASEGESTYVEVTSAPLQANYRTNIYGSLLTDNVNINIELGEWSGYIYEPQEMGDMISEGLYYNPTIKTYFITSEEGLVYMGTYSQSLDLQNKKVMITKDMNMEGKTLTPIHNGLGIIDGQGHTISNLTINGTTNVGFLSDSNGTLQNLNFVNAKITGQQFVGVAVGYNNCGRINNVTVDGAVVTCNPYLSNGKYTGGNKAGGITGYCVSSGSTVYVTNCSVEDVTVIGYREVGAVVGYMQYDTNPCYASNNTATDCSVTANQKLPDDGVYKEECPFYAGEISGYWGPNVGNTNNKAVNVSLTTISSTGETTASVASQSALQTAAKNSGATITLQPGSYSLPSSPASGIVITGTKDAVIDMLTNPGKNLPTSGYEDVTFKGLTLNGTSKYNYYGVQGTDVTFEDCTFNSTLWGYVDGLTIKNCTFNGDTDSYCIWIYTANNINISDCVFNCTNKGILFYNEAVNPQTAVITDCKFTASNPEPGKSAIMLNQCGSYFDVTVTGCTETGFPVNSISNSALWGVKDKPNYTINVDGTVFSSSN